MLLGVLHHRLLLLFRKLKLAIACRIYPLMRGLDIHQFWLFNFLNSLIIFLNLMLLHGYSSRLKKLLLTGMHLVDRLFRRWLIRHLRFSYISVFIDLCLCVDPRVHV